MVRTSGAFTTPALGGRRAGAWSPSADYGKGAPSALLAPPTCCGATPSSGKLVVWHMDWGGVRASGVFTSPDSAGDLVWQVFGPR